MCCFSFPVCLRSATTFGDGGPSGSAEASRSSRLPENPPRSVRLQPDQEHHPMRIVLSFLTALILATAACGNQPAGSDQIELQRVQSGDIDVVVLSGDGALKHGKDTFTLEFRRGDSLVDV